MNDAELIEIIARALHTKYKPVTPWDETPALVQNAYFSDAQAALAALCAAGWAVVPVKITPAIACALEDCSPPDSPHWNAHPCKDIAIARLIDDYTEIWAAALSAATPARGET